MGNGVGIHQHQHDSRTAYVQIEKLCRKHYFYEHIDDYIQAVTYAIENNRLDCLELLLVSGDIKSIYPIHLAAKVGKLEPLELLISAGFPGNTLDRESRTPLHVAAFSSSSEIGLVVSLLCLSFPRTINQYDRDGYKPIHRAVAQNNLSVLQALLRHGASENDLTQNGKTTIKLAKSLKAKSILAYLQSRKDEENEILSRKSVKKHSTVDDVSQDRILQVWERFFDNAFKHAGVPMDDYADNTYSQDDPYEPYSYDSYDSKHDFYVDDFWKASSKSTHHSSVKKPDTKDSKKSQKHRSAIPWTEEEQLALVSSFQEDWLEWIVCYDDSIEDISDAYYIINRSSQERRWLSDHWSFLQSHSKYPFLNASQEVVGNWPFPSTLTELTTMGWCIYYDHFENLCYWMNLVTSIFEYYLPLGFTEASETLGYYNLVISEDYPGWVEADQYCTTCWIVVTYEDDDNYYYSSKDDDCYSHQYYLNTVTHQTRWEAPPQWEVMKEWWNGWIPCAMESEIQSVFWYNPNTGESSWG